MVALFRMSVLRQPPESQKKYFKNKCQTASKLRIFLKQNFIFFFATEEKKVYRPADNVAAEAQKKISRRRR